MSNEIYEKLEICRKSILQKTNFKPEVAVILGSGLGEYASKIKIEQIIPYTEIEGFPIESVCGILCVLSHHYFQNFTQPQTESRTSQKSAAPSCPMPAPVICPV